MDAQPCQVEPGGGFEEAASFGDSQGPGSDHAGLSFCQLRAPKLGREEPRREGREEPTGRRDGSARANTELLVLYSAAGVGRGARGRSWWRFEAGPVEAVTCVVTASCMTSALGGGACSCGLCRGGPGREWRFHSSTCALSLPDSVGIQPSLPTAPPPPASPQS